MPDRVKILRGAECCKYVEPSQNGCPEECPYLPEGHLTCGLDPLLDDVIVLIRKQETVATNTNVLGKWIRLTGMAPPEYHGHKICSVCESFAPYDPLHPWREMLSPYCPGCGAKMEVQDAVD